MGQREGKVLFKGKSGCYVKLITNLHSVLWDATSTPQDTFMSGEFYCLCYVVSAILVRKLWGNSHHHTFTAILNVKTSNVVHGYQRYRETYNLHLYGKKNNFSCHANRGIRFFQNVRTYITNYIASYNTRLPSNFALINSSYVTWWVLSEFQAT